MRFWPARKKAVCFVQFLKLKFGGPVLVPGGGGPPWRNWTRPHEGRKGAPWEMEVIFERRRTDIPGDLAAALCATRQHGSYRRMGNWKDSSIGCGLATQTKFRVLRDKRTIHGYKALVQTSLVAFCIEIESEVGKKTP